MLHLESELPLLGQYLELVLLQQTPSGRFQDLFQFQEVKEAWWCNKATTSSLPDIIPYDQITLESRGSSNPPFEHTITTMDFSFKHTPGTIPSNSGTLLWNEELRSSETIPLVYLFSVASFAAFGCLTLGFARRILSSYFEKEPEFHCPEYQVQNGDMGPGLIEGFAKVRICKIHSIQSFPTSPGESKMSYATCSD